MPSLSDFLSMAGAGSISTGSNNPWGTGASGDLSVLVGRKDQGSQLMGLRGQQQSTLQDETQTVNEMLADGYKRSPDEIRKLQQQMWLAGMYDGTGVTNPNQIPYGSYDENTIQAYGNFLILNARQNARGQSTTLDDTMSQLIKDRTATGQVNGIGARSSTSYDLSDPDTAKAILTNVLQAYTGIGSPDPSTVSAFQQALNSYEQAHPATSESTYGSNYSGTDTTKTGGLSAQGKQQFAQDWLFQNQGPQVANYEAATSYYQAALQALRAPVTLQ